MATDPKKPIRLTVDLEYEEDIIVPCRSVEEARALVNDAVRAGCVVRDRLEDKTNVYAEIYPITRVRKFQIHDAS